MKKDYRKLIMVLFNILIISINSIIYWRIWTFFYKMNIVEPFYEKGTILLVLLYSLILTILTSLYGGYKVGFNRITELIYSHTLAFIFTNIITYIQISLISRSLVSFLPIIIMTVLQILLGVTWAYLANKKYFSMYPPIKSAIIHNREDIGEFLEKLGTRKDRYIISLIHDESKEVVDLFNALKESQIEGVFIFNLNEHKRKEIINFCLNNSIKVFILPSLEDIFIKSSDLFNIFDTPLLAFKNTEIPIELIFIKRSLDIILSLLLILLCLPIIILIAILIKIEDGGPIIYKQDRLTKDDRTFKMMKFRSMIEKAESDGLAVLSNESDKRVTRVGKCIRKIRFDEIPQFINILKGDMSLVGPRPEGPEIAAEYIKKIPEFKYRTRVKAGLTGYAQLMGKYKTSPEDKLKLDLYYIGNYSITNDLILIITTLRKMVSRS